MRITVRLSQETVDALDRWAAGRLRSDAVRDAIVLAAQMRPILDRLDAIEGQLKVLTGGSADAPPHPAPVPNDAVARTIAAALGSGFLDEDEA